MRASALLFSLRALPREEDSTNEPEKFRDEMLSHTLNLITQQNAAYTQLHGDPERLKTDLKVVETLTKDLLCVRLLV